MRNIFFKILLITVGALSLTACGKYVKPKVSEVAVVTKGAGIGKTGGGVIEKSYISPKPYKVAGATEGVVVEKLYYTPTTLSKTLPITMERDDNVQVSFSVESLYSINAEKAYITLEKFKNFHYEMERILGKTMQYKLSKKAFGFKEVVSSDKELTTEELEKLNEFSDRGQVADELRDAFVANFNKSFPNFQMIDMQKLPEKREERLEALENAFFYLNGMSLTSIDIDKEQTRPFAKIAVSQYRTKKAELTKEIKDVKGKIETQKAENVAAGIALEAESVTNELMSYLSRDIVTGAVENPSVKTKLFIEINPDLSINFDEK